MWMSNPHKVNLLKCINVGFNSGVSKCKQISEKCWFYIHCKINLLLTELTTSRLSALLVGLSLTGLVYLDTTELIECGVFS